MVHYTHISMVYDMFTGNRELFHTIYIGYRKKRSLSTFFTAKFTGALCRDQKTSSIKTLKSFR